MSNKYLARSVIVKLVLGTASALLFQQKILATQSVVLSWTPSISPNIVSYAVYYGTSSQNYTNEVTVANTNSAAISGLADGTTYYFAAAAIDSAGVVSPTSNQAVYETPSAAATLTTLPASTGGFSFNVSGVSGYQYVVQSSTDLINWVSLATNTAPFAFTDIRTPHLSHCFYRTFYLQP